MLRCNETLFNFDGALHPMKATSRRTFAFDTRSVLLFTALSLGGGAALQAQTAPGAAPKAQGGGVFRTRHLVFSKLSQLLHWPRQGLIGHSRL